MSLILCIFAYKYLIFAAMRNQPTNYYDIDHKTSVGTILYIGSVPEHFLQGHSSVPANTYHFHNSLEIVIIENGSLTGMVNNVRYEMQSGMVGVLGSELPHCITAISPDCKMTLVHIPFEFLQWNDERFPELRRGAGFVMASRSGLVFNSVAVFKKVKLLSKRAMSAKGFLRLSMLMQIIHQLCESEPNATILAESFTPALPSVNDSAIDRTYRFIYAHFLEPLELGDIAHAAGISRAALCRAFKRRSGCTVFEFITRLRIEYACNLLRTTWQNVTQIAYQSGFNSYAHFSAKFREVAGCTPSEYRLIDFQR